MIRVGIADDHAQTRKFLRILLGQLENLEVVFEAVDGREAVACVREYQPDIVVMDVYMPELDGFRATQQIKKEELPTRIILISFYEGDHIVRKAAAIGAHGFVDKGANIFIILPDAIEIVYRGGSYFTIAS